jgi:glycosyltransferase involved in cell wall biosynthesis
VPNDPVTPAVVAVSAFFPCYNDEPTIAAMVQVVLGAIDRCGITDSEVIVVNDGSTDGSAAVLAELACREPRLRVVTHDRNRGYGGALLSGFAAATKQWVFYTDGDGQYDPTELEALVRRAAEDVDIVQGYKLRRADGVARTIVGRTYHWFVKMAFGLEIRDTDCDFRLIRGTKLDDVELVHTTGAITVELVRKLQDSGARFAEVGVHHYRRAFGKSEFFRIGAIVRTLWALAGLWVELVVLRRGRRR